MLPFRHIRGYTLFPKAYLIRGDWRGQIDVLHATLRTSHAVPGTFKTEGAARAAAAIDTASLANMLQIYG